MNEIFARTEGAILFISLARIHKKNALNYSSHEQLDEIFEKYDLDSRLRVAIISSDCPGIFCAGQDLKEIAAGARLEFPPGGFGGLTSRLLSKPVIAAVDGLALGGGFELALASDIVIASRTAQFGLPEARVGLAPLAGGIQRLTRTVGHHRAMEVMMSDRRLSADQALEWGLVNEVVDGNPMASARRWADDILKASPLALAAIKKIAERDASEPFRGLDGVWESSEVIKLLGSDHPVEGATAFMTRRTPTWSMPPS